MTDNDVVIYGLSFLNDTVEFWTWEGVNNPNKLDYIMLYNFILSDESSIDFSRVPVEE